MISAANLLPFYELLRGAIDELFKWLSEQPDSYFIVAALFPVLIALISRDLLGLLWASLSCLVVIAVLGTKDDHLSPIIILFVSASSLLVVVRRIFASARNRYVLRQLAVLQHRVSMLESATQTQFFQSLKDVKPPIATGTLSSDQGQKIDAGHDAHH